MQSAPGVLAPRLSIVSAIVIAIAACGTGDNRVDPHDLELRDLLGVTPDAALAWNAAQRAAARDVLAEGLAEDAPVETLALDARRPIDDRIARALGALDRDRAADGASALGAVRVAIRGGLAEVVARPAASALAAGAAKPAVEIWLSDAWAGGALPARGLDVLASIAADAGHTAGPVIVVPSSQLSAIAAYVTSGERPRLVVNPVLLAALEPVAAEEVAARTGGLTTVSSAAPTASPVAASRPAPVGAADPAAPTTAASTTGNPYSFYGSIAECAFAQRTRCESCLSAGNCRPITNAGDGNAECTQLAAGDGRGYHLICINLGLAIASVDLCAADAAPGCPSDNNAASELAKLESNANFFEDATCRTALDACLADIYGPPPGEFPEPGPDGGGAPPPRPPRDTNVDCGDSCDDDNENCEASPSCSCEGPSCNNSLSCDSTCSSSNDTSGCSGDCAGDSGGDGESCGDDGGGSDPEGGGCGDDGGGGGDGGDSGGCGGDDGGGGGGDSCGSDSGSGGDSCGGDSCGSSDSGGGDSCGGDSCGSSDSGGGGGGCGGDGGGCGGDGGGGGCGGGGSSSNGCNTARRNPSPTTTWLVSLAWALMPVPLAALVRRRSRRRPADPGGDATADQSGEPARGEEVSP